MKKIQNILYIAAAALAMQSCNLLGSLDNIKPKYVLDDETLITDARSAEQALRGVYTTWNDYGTGVFRNAQFVLSGTISRSNNFGATDFTTNTVKTDNKMVQDYYTGLYKVVNMANSVIESLEKNENIQGLTPERRTEIIAEAKFNRALAYHLLLKTFGEFWDIKSENGVVYWDKPARANTPKKRSSVKSTYDKIMEDLDFVSKSARVTLDETDPFGMPIVKPHVYATRFAGKALMARNLLYMKEYGKAKTLCNEILAEAEGLGFRLEENYTGIYEGAYSSPEHIFTLHTLSPLNKPQLNLYDFSIYQTGNVVKGIADKLNGDPADGDMNTGNGYDKRFADCFAGMNRKDPSRINKYLYDNATPNQPANTIYFMRLAEIHYILAEASILGDKDYNGARKALADVCGRAGYDIEYFNGIPDEKLLDELFMHKYIEFCAENGEEFIDAVRLKVHAGSGIAERMGMNLNKYLMPIPKEAIGGNNLLLQNEQYVTNK